MPFCYSQEIKNFDEFKEAMLLANKTWNEIKPQAETKEFYQRVFTRKIIEDIDNLRSVPQFYENTAVSTVVARFDSLRSFSNIELAALLQDSLSISNIMQWLEYNKIPWHRLNKKPFNSGIFSSVFRDYREGVRKDIDDEKSALNTRSVLLPLTAHSGVDLDGTVQWSQNPLPVISDRPSCPLAVLFEAVGLYDKAWRVQLEENEVRYYNFDHPNKRYCSFYVSAANTAYLSGNKKLGWSFLMNAAVFEDEKSFDLAMETAKLWFDVEAGKKELPEQKILMGDERKNVFLDIVKCYQEAMNAHPRAWLFIQEYKNEFDDADGLIKKIQDDWLNNIKMIHSVGFINEIVMYGVELYPAKNDPLSVTIPWPFPDGSVEKVKKKIRELADKITEDEKDGLIKWYFEDGKLAVKAKYISCNDNEVIVERENGEKEKLEIAKLFDGNKNYIYRRLAIRNIMVEDFCTLFHDWITSTNLLVQIDAKYLSLDEDNIITLELK
ncbi:MAG: hypothetical protein LBH59_08295, partial [Planctomycetaceae bacterium]|nr:hypothetical protein [Planctomycetaceae bacterium]